jgi:spermidine synthase
MRGSWIWSTAVALLAIVTGASAVAQSKLIHSERSLYREVLVYEGRGERCMCFVRECRIGRQTCTDVANPDRIVMDYPQMMLGGLFVNPAPKEILIIGLGGGTLPRALSQIAPQARMDIIEIDPAVIKVAKRYFGFEQSERANAIQADGRVYVKRAMREQRRYDMIMLDAFDHEYIPEHLLTREFLQEVKSLLAPNGVLVANTFSSSRLYDHESTTYASVFPEFFNLKRANRVIIAVNGTLPSQSTLLENSTQFEAPFARLGISAPQVRSLFSTKRDWNADARILTDQYSPANLLNLRGD